MNPGRRDTWQAVIVILLALFLAVVLLAFALNYGGS